MGAVTTVAIGLFGSAKPLLGQLMACDVGSPNKYNRNNSAAASLDSFCKSRLASHETSWPGSRVNCFLKN